jgi:hypothetical protein
MPRSYIPANLVLPSLPTYQWHMAKRVKQLPQNRGTVRCDFVFEDGSRRSDRRGPMESRAGRGADPGSTRMAAAHA